MYGVRKTTIQKKIYTLRKMNLNREEEESNNVKFVLPEAVSQSRNFFLPRHTDRN